MSKEGKRMCCIFEGGEVGKKISQACCDGLERKSYPPVDVIDVPNNPNNQAALKGCEIVIIHASSALSDYEIMPTKKHEAKVVVGVEAICKSVEPGATISVRVTSSSMKGAVEQAAASECCKERTVKAWQWPINKPPC